MMNASRPILLIRLSSEIPTELTKYSLQQYSNSNMSAKYKNYIGYTTLSRSNIQHFFSCPLSKGIFNRLNYKRLQMWSIDFKHTLYVGVLVWALMLKWNPCIIDVCCEWLNQWLWHYMFWQKLFWKHDTKDDWSSVLTFYWMSVLNVKQARHSGVLFFHSLHNVSLTIWYRKWE